MTKKGTSNQNNEAKTPETEPWTSSRPSKSRWLKVPRFFSDPDVHPFEQIEWEKRHAKITGDNGEIIFEQKNAEVPVSWSQLAAKVVVSKYFYGDIDSSERESSVKQLIHRVCRSVADRGLKDG